jgi:hypothetical protein
MSEQRGPALALHRLQLSSVWVSDISAARRKAREGDPAGPSVNANGPRGVALIANSLGFRCTFDVQVVIPLPEGEAFQGQLRLLAHFSASERVSLRIAREFSRTQAVYLLWPYARAYFDQVSMLCGFGAPPLPLLVVPR